MVSIEGVAEEVLLHLPAESSGIQQMDRKVHANVLECLTCS